MLGVSLNLDAMLALLSSARSFILPQSLFLMKSRFTTEDGEFSISSVAYLYINCI